MSTGHKRMDFSHYPQLSLKSGEVLFQEDDKSIEMYVLLTGRIGVYRRGVCIATIEEPLSIVGETSALTKKPRNATVQALERATLLVLSDPDKLFEEFPQLGSKVARILAERVTTMNVKFVELRRTLSRTLGGEQHGRTVGALDPTEPNINLDSTEKEILDSPTQPEVATQPVLEEVEGAPSSSSPAGVEEADRPPAADAAKEPVPTSDVEAGDITLPSRAVDDVMETLQDFIDWTEGDPLT